MITHSRSVCPDKSLTTQNPNDESHDVDHRSELTHSGDNPHRRKI